MKPLDQIVLFITTRIYHLKKRGMPKRKWRQAIAREFVPRHPGQSDDFCYTWNYLKTAGLV